MVKTFSTIMTSLYEGKKDEKKFKVKEKKWEKKRS